MVVVTGLGNAKRFTSYQEAQQEMDKHDLSDEFEIVEEVWVLMKL